MVELAISNSHGKSFLFELLGVCAKKASCIQAAFQGSWIILWNPDTAPRNNRGFPLDCREALELD